MAAPGLKLSSFAYASRTGYCDFTIVIMLRYSVNSSFDLCDILVIMLHYLVNSAFGILLVVEPNFKKIFSWLRSSEF